MECRTETAVQQLTQEDLKTETAKVVHVEERERMEKQYMELVKEGMDDDRERLEQQYVAAKAAAVRDYHDRREIMSPREHVSTAAQPAVLFSMLGQLLAVYSEIHMPTGVLRRSFSWSCCLRGMSWP